MFILGVGIRVPALIFLVWGGAYVVRCANALAAPGVPVEYREYPGMIHAFFGMVPAVDDAMNAQRTVCDAFRRAFA